MTRKNIYFGTFMKNEKSGIGKIWLCTSMTHTHTQNVKSLSNTKKQTFHAFSAEPNLFLKDVVLNTDRKVHDTKWQLRTMRELSSKDEYKLKLQLFLFNGIRRMSTESPIVFLFVFFHLNLSQFRKDKDIVLCKVFLISSCTWVHVEEFATSVSETHDGITRGTHVCVCVYKYIYFFEFPGKKCQKITFLHVARKRQPDTLTSRKKEVRPILPAGKYIDARYDKKRKKKIATSIEKTGSLSPFKEKS